MRTKNPVMVAAGRKAWETRRKNEIQRQIDTLEEEYKAQTSAGKKAALRRKINNLKNSL